MSNSNRMQRACDEIVVWSLALLAALLPLALNPYGSAFFESPKMALFRFATLVAVTAWAVKSVAARRFVWIRTALDWPLLALLASASISTVLALNPHVSFYGYLNRFDGLLALACYIALFYLAVNFIRTKRQLGRLVFGFVGGAGVTSLIGVLERVGLYVLPYTQGPGGLDPTRSSATYGNALYLGAFLTLALPATLTLVLYFRVRLDERRRDGLATDEPVLAVWGVTAIVALETAALVATQGRAAWLGAAVGVVVVLVLYLWHGRSTAAWRHLVIPLIALVAAGLIYAAVTTSSRAPGQEPVAKRAESAMQLSSGTVASRLYMWRMTLPMIAARPIFGWGLDSYLEVFPRFRPPDWYRKIAENAVPDKPHNDLLQAATGQGLVGLAAYVAMLATFFFTIARAAARSKDPLRRFVLAAVLAAGAGYVIQLQFSFAIVGVAPLFWLVVGLGISFAEAAERKSRTVVLDAPAAMAYSPAGSAVQAILGVVLVALFIWATVGLGRSVASDVYVRSSQTAIDKGAAIESLRLLKAAETANPHEARFPMLVAQAYERQYMRDPQSAYAEAGLAAARRAEKLDPYFAESYLTEAGIYRQISGRVQRRPLLEAAGIYRKVLSFDRYNEDAYFNLALTLYDLRSYERAASTMRVALNLKPDDGDAYVALAAALLKLDRIDEARAALIAGLKRDPNNALAADQLRRLNSLKPDARGPR